MSKAPKFNTAVQDILVRSCSYCSDGRTLMHACMHACFGEQDKDSIKALNIPDVPTMKITIFRTMLMLILVVEALQNLPEL